MALSVFKATYTEFFFVSPYVTHLYFGSSENLWNALI